MDNVREKYIDKVYESLIASSVAAYYIDIEKNIYEEIKANSLFHQILSDHGEIEKLYKELYMGSREKDLKTVDNYEVFINTDLFKKRFYVGRMQVCSEQGMGFYLYQVMSASDTERILFLVEDDMESSAKIIEREKYETMQENFLFSMIIDLKKDACSNSSTPEIRACGDGDVKCSYSQWRYMILNMFLPDDKSMFLQMSEPEYIIERLQKEKMFKFEMKMQNMQGKYIWSRFMFSRTREFSKENPVLLYTVQDVNEDMLRLLHQENIIAAVEEKNQKLSDINKQKSVFISNMSHEIRTPINAVIGMNEMILREAEKKSIFGYAKNIKNAANMLLSMINNILDYSKIEAGRMEIVPVEYNIAAMLRQVGSMLSIQMKEKNLSFQLKLDRSLPVLLMGDELRIKQIIVNLLTNAVKYTEEGSISLEVTGERAGDMVNVSVKVSDTGIGMREDEMSKLFVAFERLDKARNHSVEGAGLGLNIVAKLLEQMGSKLEVQSEYGVGSVFSFVISQKIVNEESICEAYKRKKEEKESVSYVVAPNAKVLVVDDDIINLEVMKGLLKRTKIQVDTAFNGKESLEKIAQNRYDLVFMDHIMPVMDGIEAMDRIKSMGEEYQGIPVVALTANVVSDASCRYKNAGFIDFLEKPIIVEKLDETLRTYLPDELIEI